MLLKEPESFLERKRTRKDATAIFPRAILSQTRHLNYDLIIVVKEERVDESA
jgi:hypothetical protein